jgi:hypothetical protein
VIVLILLWGFLRYVLALAGFVCLLLSVSTLTGWFTVVAEGAQLQWYWLLAAAFMFGFLSIVGDTPFPGVRRDGPRLVAPDRRLAPSIAHPIPEIVRAMLVAGVWGGLTYLLGLNQTVILVGAAVVGIALSLRRLRRGRHVGAARNWLRGQNTGRPGVQDIQLPGDWEIK